MIWHGLTFCRQQVMALFDELHLAQSAEYRTGYLMHRTRVGVPLRDALEERYLRVPEPGVLVVDFTGVEEMTGSVAEEIGPKLFALTAHHRAVNPEKYLIYDNLLPEVRNELDAWFARHDQCVPAFLQQETTEHPIIGTAPAANLMEVLDHCYRHGPLVSADLEQSVAAAAKKLADLNRHYPWLFHRQKVIGDTPRQWYYQIIPLLPADRLQPPTGEQDAADGDRAPSAAHGATEREPGR